MLARYWASYRDELEADFQQFYNINLEDIGKSLSIRHAAVLAAHLPPDSRCLAAIDPNFGWSKELHMMAKIEHEMRVILWQNSQSKKNKTPFPKPIDPPAKTAKVQKKLENTNLREIDECLGMGGESHGR